MWFIGVEVQRETSARPPKKILDPPLCRLSPSYQMCLLAPLGPFTDRND